MFKVEGGWQAIPREPNFSAWIERSVMDDKIEVRVRRLEPRAYGVEFIDMRDMMSDPYGLTDVVFRCVAKVKALPTE
ncbi:MAG TPA: hypothetical protein VN903_01330 [Polyangia bacterium]|nr:hypothetical protein [Polyangia bacterium]